MRISNRILLVILTLLCFNKSVLSESIDGRSIRGKVVDASTREPLIGANVLVVGTTIGAATNINGEFIINGLDVGTYRLRISSIGYTTQVVTDVVVAAGRMTEVMAQLEPTVIDIEGVDIQAEYFRSSTDLPVSAQSLSYEEIRRSPGGQEDVIRAISVLPGVVQVSAGRNDLIVRGGAPSENLYIVDGLEIPNINHFGTQGATGGPLSYIDLDFVRDVTFSTGGFGAKYGDKLSSVMNIQLMDGRTDRIGGKATISATQFGLNAKGPFSERGTFLFSARRSYLDFIFKAAGFGFVPEYWDFFGKAVMQLDTQNELNFFMIGALDNVRFFNDTEDKRYSNSRILGNSQNQYVSAFSWRHLLPKGFLTVTLGRTYVAYDFLQSDSLLNPIFESSSREGETILHVDGVFVPTRGMELSAGVSGKMLRIEGSLGGSVNPYFPQSPIPASAWETTAFKASAYAQAAMRFGSLSLLGGARIDYFNMIENSMTISPRATATYYLSPVLSLTLSGGQYHQAPSTIWLVSNPINKRLNNIAVDQIISGVEFLVRPDTRLRLEAFWKSYHDYPANVERPYLVMANTGAGFGGGEEGFASFGFDPLISEGEGLSRGIEVLVQKKLSDIPCYGIFSFTYAQTEFTALDGIERNGTFDQRIILNLSGGYKPSEDWDLSLKLRFGTGLPYTPFRADGQPDFTRYNSERLPFFHALDIRADKRWEFSGWSLITYIDIQNVYNRKNIQGYRWDYRNNEVESNSGAIGILPTIGVSAEF